MFQRGFRIVPRANERNATGTLHGDSELQTLRAELEQLRTQLARFAENVSTLHQEMMLRTQRAESTLNELVLLTRQQGQLGTARLLAQEAAFRKVEAELFTLRGRLDARASSILPKNVPVSGRERRRVVNENRGRKTFSVPNKTSPRPTPSSQGYETLLKKLRKLQQTPLKFFSDSSIPWLRLGGKILRAAKKRRRW